MKLRSHVIASIIFSTLFFVVFKSWKISAVSFLSGVLIDCDHIIDYSWEFRKRFRLNEFFSSYYNDKFLFFMVILHSWELLVSLGVCSFLIDCNPWIVGITIGFTQHLALDQIFDKPSRLAYFFFWRFKRSFNAKKIFKVE